MEFSTGLIELIVARIGRPG